MQREDTATDDAQGKDTCSSSSDDVLKQFKRAFGPEADINLYFGLNSDSDEDSSDMAYIRIEQLMAEINGVHTASNNNSSSSASSRTRQTLISSESTDMEPLFEEDVIMSPTSSSSLYAIRSPSPLMMIGGGFARPYCFNERDELLTQQDSDEEGITLTEVVEVHRVPSLALIALHDGNNAVTTTTSSSSTAYHTTTEMESHDYEDSNTNNNNNNTSCSISSNLTDSKTLDNRTPIVV